MMLLRALLVMVLVLAVMPWGAFATEVARLDRAAATAPEATPLDRQAGAELTLSRRCPGPALPGAPCHPDAGLLPGAMTAPGSEAARTRAPAAILPQEGGGPQRILDPPRMG